MMRDVASMQAYLESVAQGRGAARSV